MVDQIVDKKTVAIPGPQGDITPELQALHDEMEAMSASTTALQDEAVSHLIGSDGSQTLVALLANSSLAKRSRQAVMIAASDSSERDKFMADYVCDGVNDEVELRAALQAAMDAQVPMMVANGGYQCDSWDSNGYMLPLPSNRQVSVDIRGFGYPYRKASGGTYELTGSVLHITDAAYAAMPSNAVVIGMRSRGLYPGVNFHISNIGIDYPDNTKRATGIDGRGASSFCASCCSVSVRQPNTLDTPESVTGFIGIIGIQVSGYGSDNLVDRCTVFLHRVGIDIEGEHMTCYQCTVRHCNYSFGVGMVSDGKRGWHDCQFVQCAQELCLNNMYILPSSSKIPPCVSIVDMTGELTTDGTWKLRSVGHVAMDATPGWKQFRVAVAATYSWAHVGLGVTLSYGLFDNQSAYQWGNIILSTYPKTILFQDASDLLSTNWTIFPGFTTKKRLPLPPVGQTVNVIINTPGISISDCLFQQAVSGVITGKTPDGSIRTYNVLVSAATGRPFFQDDEDDINAGRNLTYPYAPQNPSTTPEI